MFVIEDAHLRRFGGRVAVVRVLLAEGRCRLGSTPGVLGEAAVERDAVGILQSHGGHDRRLAALRHRASGNTTDNDDKKKNA